MAFKVEHPDYGPAWLYFEHAIPSDILGPDGTKYRFHGATTVILEDADGNPIDEATVTVHFRDHFVKEEGRRQAIRKLQRQLKEKGYDGQFLGAVWHAYNTRNQVRR